jgi:hypothetical protein
MSRDATVRFYTTDENKKWLTEQAGAADQSLSEYCHQAITEYIGREQERQEYGRYGVDQQIELILNQIRDDASTLLSEFQSETGTRLERIQRIRAVYVIALWRLVENDYTRDQREEAMKAAAEVVGRAPSDDPEIQTAIPSPETHHPQADSASTDSTHSNLTTEDSE